MLIRVLKSGVERHVERDLGSTLVEAGLAEEIIREGGVQPAPAPDCRLIWAARRAATSEFPVVSAVCAHCRVSHYYTVDAREPWRRKEYQNRWVNGAYKREFGGVENFAVFHRGQREVIPPAILEQVRALGIPNPETAYQGTPPLEFLQMSGDPIRDQQTIINGKRPADPQPGKVIQYMTGQQIVKET